MQPVPQIRFPANPSLAPDVPDMPVIGNVGTDPTGTVIDAYYDSSWLITWAADAVSAACARIGEGIDCPDNYCSERDLRLRENTQVPKPKRF